MGKQPRYRGIALFSASLARILHNISAIDFTRSSTPTGNASRAHALRTEGSRFIDRTVDRSRADRKTYFSWNDPTITFICIAFRFTILFGFARCPGTSTSVCRYGNEKQSGAQVCTAVSSITGASVLSFDPFAPLAMIPISFEQKILSINDSQSSLRTNDFLKLEYFKNKDTPA